MTEEEMRPYIGHYVEVEYDYDFVRGTLKGTLLDISGENYKMNLEKDTVAYCRDSYHSPIESGIHTFWCGRAVRIIAKQQTPSDVYSKFLGGTP